MLPEIAPRRIPTTSRAIDAIATGLQHPRSLYTKIVPYDFDRAEKLDPMALFRLSGTLGLSPFFQPTTDATCMGGSRYCCCAGRSGLAPICVLGSGASSLQPLRSNVLHNNAEKVSLRWDIKAQLQRGAGTPWSSRATR